MEESKTLSEETTCEVISPACGNSQPDSEVVADFSLSQDSEMESENHPSQSILSQLIECDDVTNENPGKEDSIDEDQINRVENIDLIDFDDDVQHFLAESDDDL